MELSIERNQMKLNELEQLSSIGIEIYIYICICVFICATKSLNKKNKTSFILKKVIKERKFGIIWKNIQKF